MRNEISILLGVSTLLALTPTGCSRKTDATSELQKVALTLETKAASTPPPAVSASGATQLPPPAQQVNQAITAYKSGNLEDAVTQLQRLRAQNVITPEQRISLQDAMAAVMTDIYARAAKGDVRAQQAVKQYELMQNAR